MVLTQEFGDALHIPRVNVNWTRGRNTTQGSIDVSIIEVIINFKGILSSYTLVSKAITGRVILPNTASKVRNRYEKLNLPQVIDYFLSTN